MSERFSTELRQQAEPIWRHIFDHPFLREIKEGSLPLEKFHYFLTQDYHYLEGFARAVAIAMAKAPDDQILELLAQRILRPIERPLHRKLIALSGMSPGDVEKAGHAPTNLAYINHMIKTATLGSLGQTAAAMLPCPWTYHEIGNRLWPVEHPIYGEWASFYAGEPVKESVEVWGEILDQAAARADRKEKEAMQAAFLTSSRYEFLFWEMAYRREVWPV